MLHPQKPFSMRKLWHCGLGRGFWELSGYCRGQAVTWSHCSRQATRSSSSEVAVKGQVCGPCPSPPHPHVPALRASPPAADPQKAGSERRDSLHVFPPPPPPAGRGRVTSQIPQGGGRVTMGTEIPQETSLYLLPTPFTARKLGTCLAALDHFLVGDPAQGHPLHEFRSSTGEGPQDRNRNRLPSPRSSNSPSIQGLGNGNLDPKGHR